jgi:hypothetical protein
MNAKRAAEAGALPIAVLACAMLAGCGSNGSVPGVAPSSSSSAGPTAASTASPSPSLSAKTSASAPAPRTNSPTPPSKVVLSRVVYQWGWPNTHGSVQVTHAYSVPPLPQLVRIGVGDHPRDPGERPFNRMSFTFTTAFPTYRFEYTSTLMGGARGTVIPLKGMGVLMIMFSQAQAHSVDGSRSSIAAQPGRDLGLGRMVDYAQAGDSEGVLTYGIGVAWPIPHSNPQIPVRAYEVETVTASGRHLYTVAFDVDSANPTGR